MSNVKRGNYYKGKTKKWFDKQGYKTEIFEKYTVIRIGKKILYKKRDIFSSDGMSISNDKIVLWNSKLNKDHIAEGRRAYQALSIPKCSEIRLWLVVWIPRVREPEIIDVGNIKTL